MATEYIGYNAKAEDYFGNLPHDFKDLPSKRDFFLKRELDDLVLTEASKFEYENLPVNLPPFEVERRLIQDGFVGIFKHELYGIVTMWGSKGGVGIYNNATTFTGAQAVLGEITFEDGIDGIIGYNTHLDKSYRGTSVIGSRILWYANILADIDLSLSMLSISARSMNTVGAKTDNAVNTIENWYKALYDGKPYVPLLETGIFTEVIPMISKDCADVRSMASDLLNMKTHYEKKFYNSLGVSYIQRKAERMVTDEVEADEDMLSINIFDQLACRAEMLARMNALYNTNAKVRVNNLVIT